MSNASRPTFLYMGFLSTSNTILDNAKASLNTTNNNNKPSLQSKTMVGINLTTSYIEVEQTISSTNITDQDNTIPNDPVYGVNKKRALYLVRIFSINKY